MTVSRTWRIAAQWLSQVLASRKLGNYDPQGDDQALEQLACSPRSSTRPGTRSGNPLLTSVALATVALAVTYALAQRDPIATAGLEAEVLANPDRYPYALRLEEIHAGVQRALLVGLVGFPLWALVGVSLGAVVRRQAAAVVLGGMLYLITFFVFFYPPREVPVLALAAVPTFTPAAAADAISVDAISLGSARPSTGPQAIARTR